jgi:phospholipid/cholesterol/gamma-HCH transport system permease protein
MKSRNSAPSSKSSLTLCGDSVQCSGEWTVFHLHTVEHKLIHLTWPESEEIGFDMSGVASMDTSGAWFLYRMVFTLKQAGRTVSVHHLDAEKLALYEYVCRHSTRPGQVPQAAKTRMLEDIGRSGIAQFRQAMGLLAFIGEIIVSALSLLRRPNRIRLTVVLQELGAAGHKALPIVGLMAFLLGVVIAYQGGVQLRIYGGNIYIVDLVGLSMVRELGPLITAIIVAGRTGSAYTAQIGTMKVTEEIDALRSLAISPLEMLVLPKLLALVIALPLLTVYADIMGVFGGMVMASSMLGVGMTTFLERLGEAISLKSYLIGVGKAPVFAAIIAVVGCFQGFQVAGSAESVGRRTTLSVVQAIFFVIVIDAGFSVVFSWLGI